MEQINIERAEQIVSDIRNYIGNSQRLEELFTTQPQMKMGVYRKTAIFYAQKKYEEHQVSNEAIPHGFYAILEHEIKTTSLIRVVKKYERELNLIAETMGIEQIEIVKILKELRMPNQYTQDTPQALEARNKLKELFRKFTSKYKENFIKKIIDQKMDLLESQTIRIENKKTVYSVSIDQFINYALYTNPLLKEAFQQIIYEKTGNYPRTEELKETIKAALSPNSEEELNKLFKITKPSSYERFKKNKIYKRIKNNFEPKLNKMFASYTEEQKEEVIKYINLKVKLKHITRTTHNQQVVDIQSSLNKETGITPKQRNRISTKYVDEISGKLKALITKENQELIEALSSLLEEIDYELVIQKGKFFFKIEPTVTKEEYEECEAYTKSESGLKKIHNEIYKCYMRLNKVHTPTINQTTAPLASTEDSYQINADIWFTADKIKNAIDAIDKDKINSMPEHIFKSLKKFLIEEGLLWSYVADNIDIHTFSKIINNFSAVYSCSQEDEIKIENLSELIRKANLYDYANDLIIGLVGIDVAAKVINYNQFSGVAVTDEIINKRIRKLVDLAVRSERTRTSSLPFTCDVKIGNYTLQRYQNNDPKIFTCGVDTKTCFFISVNENDFFFYSLLNKNGYVVKVVNKDNELVARASCFRKNNVLMINGIRCKNNKVNPQSQEETKEMIEIVNLFKGMAQKMIELTTQDQCPIDYVVCNKAGILENNELENYFGFEQINADLFREPINIYDEDWQEFVHTYDSEPEQLLQECADNPEKSFATDFGNHYPAILISSRNYMPLTSPRHISLDDQPSTYIRPRRGIEEYISFELTDEIIERINRIRALACFTGTEEEQNAKKANYRLITSNKEIKSLIIGDDWCIIIKPDSKYEIYFANETNQRSLIESKGYIVRIKETFEPANAEFELESHKIDGDTDVKIYRKEPKKS